MSGLTTPEQPINTNIANVWHILRRALAIVVILIATICLLLNTVGLIGVWIIRRPACSSVIKLETFVNQKLGTINNALLRVSARATDGKQALTAVNNSTSKLTGRLEQDRPLLTALKDAADETLTPKIADIRTQAAALHDGIISVNSALETLDNLGLFNVPTFTDQLNAVSARIDSLEENVQDWRTAIDQARTGALANVVDSVTSRTTKLDDLMTQIQSAAVKYQATVAEKRQQVSDLANKLLRVINLVVLVTTALFLVVAAGQIMLIRICWQSLRLNKKGRAVSVTVLL